MLGSVNCNWGSRRVPVLAGVTVLVIGVIAIGVFFSRTVTVTGYPSSSQVRSDTDTQYGEPFWVDEFDGRAGSRPNDQYWRTEIGNYDQEGWGNNELQFYTDSAVNSSLNGDGQLLILAREAPAGEKLSCWGGDTCSYTSARLTTEGTVSI